MGPFMLIAVLSLTCNELVQGGNILIILYKHDHSCWFLFTGRLVEVSLYVYIAVHQCKICIDLHNDYVVVHYNARISATSIWR
jgi:hypothetical protein